VPFPDIRPNRDYPVDSPGIFRFAPRGIVTVTVLHVEVHEKHRDYYADVKDDESDCSFSRQGTFSFQLESMSQSL